MPFQALTWTNGDDLTSAKLAQMVENLATHDHRFAGGQGAPIARFAAGVDSITANGTSPTFLSIAYPAGRFDPAGPIPVPIVNPDSTAFVTSLKSWGVRNMTVNGFDAWVYRTVAGAIPITWTACQAPT
jgi:hypothetical protein